MAQWVCDRRRSVRGGGGGTLFRALSLMSSSSSAVPVVMRMGWRWCRCRPRVHTRMHQSLVDVCVCRTFVMPAMRASHLHNTQHTLAINGAPHATQLLQPACAHTHHPDTTYARVRPTRTHKHPNTVTPRLCSRTRAHHHHRRHHHHSRHHRVGVSAAGGVRLCAVYVVLCPPSMFCMHNTYNHTFIALVHARACAEA